MNTTARLIAFRCESAYMEARRYNRPHSAVWFKSDGTYRFENGGWVKTSA